MLSQKAALDEGIDFLPFCFDCNKHLLHTYVLFPIYEDAPGLLKFGQHRKWCILH